MNRSISIHSKIEKVNRDIKIPMRVVLFTNNDEEFSFNKREYVLGLPKGNYRRGGYHFSVTQHNFFHLYVSDECVAKYLLGKVGYIDHKSYQFCSIWMAYQGHPVVQFYFYTNCVSIRKGLRTEQCICHTVHPSLRAYVSREVCPLCKIDIQLDTNTLDMLHDKMGLQNAPFIIELKEFDKTKFDNVLDYLYNAKSIRANQGKHVYGNRFHIREHEYLDLNKWREQGRFPNYDILFKNFINTDSRERGLERVKWTTSPKDINLFLVRATLRPHLKQRKMMREDMNYRMETLMELSGSMFYIKLKSAYGYEDEDPLEVPVFLARDLYEKRKKFRKRDKEFLDKFISIGQIMLDQKQNKTGIITVKKIRN